MKSISRKLKEKEGRSFRHQLQTTMSLGFLCGRRSPTGRTPKASQYLQKVAVSGVRNMQSLLTIPRQERSILFQNIRGGKLIPPDANAHLLSNSLLPLAVFLELLQKLFASVLDDTCILGGAFHLKANSSP
jgi:hypothetical protein